MGEWDRQVCAGEGGFYCLCYCYVLCISLAALLSVGRAGCLDQSRSSIQPDQQIASARGFVERGIVYYLRRF